MLARFPQGIAYGMGRSYGDACLNPDGILWNTTLLDRLIHFDRDSGRLVCEPGAALGNIQRIVLAQGWSLPVTPGTQWVTVGGAIANDVHGRNHHVQGSFGHHVKNIQLLRTDGELIECGPQQKADWFAATLGGVGLTGLITQAEIQLQPSAGAWVDAEIIPYNTLEEFFQLADEADPHWEHTLSWMDCLAQRNHLFIRGRPAQRQRAVPRKRQFSIPFTPPFRVVRKPFMRLFNMLYFAWNKNMRRRATVDYVSFAWPLDALRHWNRLYGPQGFFQYQCVIPHGNRSEGIQSLLDRVFGSKCASFLATLKTFGKHESLGMLGFPRHGATLTLDFANQGAQTSRLLQNLDAIVQEHGGRVYLAKDARMSRECFAATYPRLKEFLAFRDKGICSGLSRRLMDSC